MIRNYNESDRPSIILLGQEYNSRFEDLYLNRSNNIIVVLKDNKLVGFLILEDTIDDINIVLLYVSFSYRRQGFASMLINYLFKQNIKRKRIVLEVSEKNEAALSLYKKNGFNIINTRIKYYKDGSDALLMEKRFTNE